LAARGVRRTRAGLRRRGRSDRAARLSQTEVARAVGARQRAGPGLRPSARLPVARPRRRAVALDGGRGATGARATPAGAVALRRADRDQSSTAIRSSTRLNTAAPTATATTVPTPRYATSTTPGIRT